MTNFKQAMTLKNHNGFWGDANNVSVITSETAKADPVLDWKVERAFSFHEYKGIKYAQDGKYHLVRTDNPSITLGAQVGQNYDILQNEEMIDWLSPYIDRDYLSIAGYGYFQYGRTVFIQCNNDFYKSVDGDNVGHYFLLRNYHGGGCFEINFCTIRAICQNTLSMASKQGNKIKIRHGQNMRDDLNTVKHRIDLAKENFESEIEVYNQMTRKKFTKNDLYDTLCEQFSKEIKMREEKAKKKDEMYFPEDLPIIKHALNNWDNLPDIQHLEDNAWKAWNAFNYNLNHGWGKMNPQDALRRMWDGTYMEKNDEFKQLVLR